MSKGKERWAADADGWSITQEADGTVTIRDNQGWQHARFKHDHIEDDKMVGELLALWRYINGATGQSIDDEVARKLRSQ